MVKRVSKFSNNNNNLSISCTGQAGPDIVTREKDLGLVFIGVKYKDKIEVFKKDLS